MAATSKALTRREVVVQGASLALAAAFASIFSQSRAADLAVVDAAYAGSMSSMMEGPIKSTAARYLRLDIRGRAQGSDALANLIAAGSIRPDVFIPITPGPMLTVLRAGKSKIATPIARTEVVIVYSPKSRFAAQFAAASRGQEPWWNVLRRPGMRFGRTDPIADPQGRNIIFTMMLAARLYSVPNLVEKTLGPMVNQRQIFSEPTLLARLQAGQLDACSAYKIQPGPFELPYIGLPKQVNLSSDRVRQENPGLELTIAGKTYDPEPLIFYAAAMNDSRNPKGAAEFVEWLNGSEAQSIFRRYQYDPPDGAPALAA
ncbi:MAG: substrate-binding domain-containing protein [Acidobacteriota bacterium]|nr:substrate-binding domain-containing protein [Acidobacteriota bacterium]MDE3169411.1 substrate-binding domain-containing protein [Acidobacteriota bacterium]